MMSKREPMTDSYFHEDTVISVLTRDVMDRMLDYRAPAGGCHAGAFVQVPLGPRKVVGVVWGPGQGNWDRAKLRQVLGVLDVVPMRAELRDFLDRAAGYTLTSQGAMLRLATRVPGLGQPPSEQILYHLGTAPAPRLTKARQQVLEVLETQGDQGLSLSELSEMAGVSTSVIKGLASFGTLEARTAPRDAPYPRLDPNKPGKPLTDDQAAAVDQLRIQAKAGGYGTTLLKGVTGSGKTEVYLESIAACLTQGRQALVLLPEIALTAEFLTRVERRFGAKPAEWHTGVTQATRRRCWNMVAQGRAQLVVGARSALFLPFQDLGLIIVDEEHDGSYKQEEGVIYNARDMAVLRASLNGAQVVLASATPSLETWANAQSGKYGRLDLPKRFGAAVMPLLRAVDMRTQDVPGGRWVSPTLQGEIKKRLEIGEQSLLFLNRRGYAPVTICRACGVQVGCDLCDARMTEHRFQNR